MDRSGPWSLTRSGLEAGSVDNAVKLESGRSYRRSYSLKELHNFDVISA